MTAEAKVTDLLGQIIVAIENRDGEELIFTLADGRKYRMYHTQYCCESVSIEDICGSLDDLIGSPLTMAEESTNSENPPGVTPEYQESFTWTFYRFATVKGYATIRWYGASNGYYSESVDFELIQSAPPKET